MAVDRQCHRTSAEQQTISDILILKLSLGDITALHHDATVHAKQS